MIESLTDTQYTVLCFINAFRLAAQCNPTCAEIAEKFGYHSANAAADHLKALEQKLVVVKRRGKSRGYIVASAYVDVLEWKT
jgi:repressor LexA